MSDGPRVRVVQADALEFLRGLDADSVDLVITSPPYLEARTYGIGAGRKLDVWVPWMVEVVTECVRVCKGLVAVVCEGQTRGYRYLPAPFLLMADLHRAGFNLRKPAVYERDGIPGSGGPDWLKNRWEPIVCVTRNGKLPWSDNTACGQPPKYGPGGLPSYRLPNGKRINRTAEELRANGIKVGGRQSRTVEGERNYSVYIPPDIANPGNVIDCGTGTELGSDIAHHSEAPFPLKLAAFFVQSFCKPNGVVLDCFMGSGTSAHAAIEHGRKFVGCDIRQSQVDLTLRRLATVTPSAFSGVA